MGTTKANLMQKINDSWSKVMKDLEVMRVKQVKDLENEIDQFKQENKDYRLLSLLLKVPPCGFPVGRHAAANMPQSVNRTCSFVV